VTRLIDRIPPDERERLDAARALLAEVSADAYDEMCDYDGEVQWALARDGETRGKVIAHFASEWGVDFTDVRLRVEWKAWEPWEPFLDLLDDRLDSAMFDVLYPDGLRDGPLVKDDEITDEQVAEAWARGPKAMLDRVLAGERLGYWDESGNGCPWVDVKRGAPGARKWWRADG